MPNQLELNYVIYKPRATITLDLFEAERYEPAIIVQSLVGNLSYYSNQGRYEPRLAKSWRRVDPKTWVFELHENLVCENGELITAENFRSSLMRSIAFLAKNDEVPILSKLVDYDLLTKQKQIDFKGIKADRNIITFNFREPIRSGLVQILSFSPFGYICSDNLNSDGSWKDSRKFISSGPYKVTSIDIGKKYVLEKRREWSLGYAKQSPDRIIFTHDLPQQMDSDSNWIVDAFTSTATMPQSLSKYPLVPEYINPIIFGNLNHGYLANKNNRLFLRSLIEKYRQELPETFGPHTRSNSFYPNQKISSPPQSGIGTPAPPNTPLLIEGTEPEIDTPRWHAWGVLKKALTEGNIPFQFTNNEASMKHVTDPNYDIRIRGSSIGGGVEAWGLRVIFCSELGPRFPDPSGRVCKAVDEYDNETISDDEFSRRFFAAVDDDSAIVPISHYGIQLFLSNKIVRDSMSPALEILRFDRLEIE